MSLTKSILTAGGFRPCLLAVILIAGQIALAPAHGQPVEISQAGEHADWPAAAFAPSGDLWVAWTAYDGKEADQVRARRRTNGEWQDIVTVSPRAGDFLKASIAIQPDGRVWIAWSAQADGNFDVYARSWHDGRWDPMEQLTSDPQPDIHHSLRAASDGKLHLVWQSFRTGDANVYLKTRDGSRWSAPIAITTHEANDWEPATALDEQDRLYVVYDSYRHGDYDVMLRVLDGSELSPEYPHRGFAGLRGAGKRSDRRRRPGVDRLGRPRPELGSGHAQLESRKQDWRLGRAGSVERGRLGRSLGEPALHPKDRRGRVRGRAALDADRLHRGRDERPIRALVRDSADHDRPVGHAPPVPAPLGAARR